MAARTEMPKDDLPPQNDNESPHLEGTALLHNLRGHVSPVAVIPWSGSAGAGF